MPTSRRSCLVFGLLLGLAATAVGAVSIDQIPSPRPTGWAVDLTSTLPAETLAELNRLGDDVKARTGAELAVVVIGSTDGAEPHDFATRLFNAWGLGERGKDNGLLVFAALDDHSVEIVLGDGLSHGEGSAVSSLVIQEEMIPRFRAGDPAGAILAGARACVQRILDTTPRAFSASAPPETAMAPTAPAQPLPASSTPLAPRSRFDPRVLIPIGLAGAVVAGFVLVLRKPRCPRCKQKMTMIAEAADDAYLEKSERVEEQIGSVDHQIWICAACGETVRRRWRRFSGHDICPECSARTLRSSSRTIEVATYDHGGRVQVDQTCANCSYSHSYTYATARRQRTTYSGRSSGFSGFGGSSSSRSSSSGFGGGRSSGGGASGRW